MLQPRLRGAATGAEASLSSLAAAFNSLALCPRHTTRNPQLSFVRHASHAAQGRANGPGDSAGRRLGAKKTATQYVIPGNIIFKQRGTKWFPGENVGMGKDHTIYATVAGYVRYYRNPTLHPKRRYIGVALDKEGPRSKLPTPLNAPTRRRLGMHLSPIKELSPSLGSSATDSKAFLDAHISDNSKGAVSVSATTQPILRAGTYRVSNFEIGKAAENKGVKVKEFDKGDRWLAWRKRAAKMKEKMMARAAKATRKTKGKKSTKKVGRGPQK